MATTTNLGNGFSFTVPVSDTVQHTLIVYVDISQGIGNLNASFNDGTTPDYNDSSLVNLTSVSTGVYTLTYQAVTAPQTLTITYTLQEGNGSGSVSASDTFDRINQTGLGKASDGTNTWTLNTISGAPVWNITSRQAVMNGAAGATSIPLLGSTLFGDGEAVCIIQASNIADSIGVVLRASTKATSYYLAVLTNGNFQILYHASGTDTVLKTVTVTYKIATQYNIRFRSVNQTLYARFWPNDGSHEPSNWQVTVQDSHLASGLAGIYGQISSASDTCIFDTYSAVNLSSAVSANAYVGLHAATLSGASGVPVSGSLSGSTATPSGPIDLTAEGINDWGKYGLSAIASFDHKASVTSQISNYTAIGGGLYTQNTSAVLGYSWEGDGSPNASATNTTTEVDITGVANGFSFTVPADTTARTLNVYVAAMKAQGQLTATLSDGSATAYVDSSLNDSSTGTALKYIITYNAANASQSLTIQWSMLTDNGGGTSTTPYASDTFARANTSASSSVATGWGHASDNEAWASAGVTGSPTYQIIGNTGEITASALATTITYLGTNTQTNMEGLVRWQQNNINCSSALILRATATNTYYRFNVFNGNTLQISKVIAGAVTTLSTTTISYLAATKYWMRARVDGNNLYAKHWADGTSEPAAWTWTGTDTAIAGVGQYGVRTRIDAAGDTVQYDSLTVTSVPSGGTPGYIGLGAATLVGNAAPPPPPPPPPPPHPGGIPVVVNVTDALTTPWLGYGVEIDAYDHDTGVPIGITPVQRSLSIIRVDALHPQLIRTVLGSVNWWCPGGVVGTYNFTTSIMQEWYNVLDYAQSNALPVIVSLLSPSPFTATATDWCTAFSDLLSYLTNTIGYTCIAYITGLSQPDTLGLTYNQYQTIAEPQLVTALAANTLTIPLLGSDTTMVNDAWLTSASTDLSASLQGYARQSFPPGIADISNDSLETALKTLISGIYTNDPTNKPIIQTEMGSGFLGPGNNVTLYQYGLEMGDFAVQIARAGIASGIAYDLDDDMHNTQWGMWKITDSVSTIRPWAFVWNVLCNTVVANSTLYTPAQQTTNDYRVLASQSPQGVWTFVLVNRNANAQQVHITVPSAPNATTTFQQYIYSNVAPLLVDINGFPLSSGTVQAVLNRGMTVSMAGNSIMILTQQIAIVSTSYAVPRPPLEKRR